MVFHNTNKVGIIQEKDYYDLAINVEHATKYYGRPSSSVTPALSGVNMSVEPGTIYALLGPSGCGKTTLLNCIVGKYELHAGTIRVFGHSPGSPGSRVPGSRVGYMPQDLALHNELTVKETMELYGALANMPAGRMRSNIRHLLGLLHLDREDQMVGTLSGGQGRRLSLAASLVHDPELVILDEPTVGVDPVLRKRIWEFLYDISKSQVLQTTVLITTHYVEEARQAGTVGLMRQGRILAEESPQVLMKSFNVNTMEDVFANLCVLDNRDTRISGVSHTYVPSRQRYKEVEFASDIKGYSDTTQAPGDEAWQKVDFSSKVNGYGTLPLEKAQRRPVQRPTTLSQRVTALVRKDFQYFKQKKSTFLLQIFLPLLRLYVVWFTLGGDPKYFDIAVVNDNAGSLGCANADFSCNTNMSCSYLSMIEQEGVLNLKYYKTLEDAKDSVETQDTQGVVHILPSFEAANNIKKKKKKKRAKLTDMLKSSSSQIQVHMDNTQYHVALVTRKHLASKLMDFYDALGRCGDTTQSIIHRSNLVFEDPLEGTMEADFTEYTMPCSILNLSYIMYEVVIAFIVIGEKTAGITDRIWVTGVKDHEVYLSLVLLETCFMSLQTILILLFSAWVLLLPFKGPLLLAFALTFFQNLCGMALGVFIGTAADTPSQFLLLDMFLYFPTMLLSGMVWPVEGMPSILRKLSYFTQQNCACEAIRGVMSKGWGFDWRQVRQGFLVTFLWIGIFSWAGYLVSKKKRKSGQRS